VSCAALARSRQRRISLLPNGNFTVDTPLSIQAAIYMACFQEEWSR
jgi:hypothetical protein